MPLYSDRNYYYTSAASPYNSSPYSGSSTYLHNNYSRPTYTAPIPPTRTTNFSSRYTPLLAPISEASLMHLKRPLTRLSSPKLGLHSSPTFNVPRPISINTADIDVSAARYKRNNIHIPIYGRTTDLTPTDVIEPKRFVPKIDENDVLDKEQPQQIQRTRPVVRLSTVRSKDTNKSREDKERNTNLIGYIRKETISPERDKVEKKSNWRDNFEYDLSPQPKEVRKTPGERLREKHLIKGLYEEASPVQESALIKRQSSKKRGLQKLPSFHDICQDISSDKINDDLNAGELRRRRSSIILEEHAEFMKNLRRLSNGNVGIDEPIPEIREDDEENKPPVIKKKSRKIKHKITATVEIDEFPINDGLKFNAVVEDEHHTINTFINLPKKKKIATPKPLARSESGEDFWGKIAARETVYLNNRKQNLLEQKQSILEEEVIELPPKIEIVKKKTGLDLKGSKVKVDKVENKVLKGVKTIVVNVKKVEEKAKSEEPSEAAKKIDLKKSKTFEMNKKDEQVEDKKVEVKKTEEIKKEPSKPTEINTPKKSLKLTVEPKQKAKSEEPIIKTPKKLIKKSKTKELPIPDSIEPGKTTKTNSFETVTDSSKSPIVKCDEKKSDTTINIEKTDEEKINIENVVKIPHPIEAKKSTIRTSLKINNVDGIEAKSPETKQQQAKVTDFNENKNLSDTNGNNVKTPVKPNIKKVKKIIKKSTKTNDDEKIFESSSNSLTKFPTIANLNNYSFDSDKTNSIDNSIVSNVALTKQNKIKVDNISENLNTSENIEGNKCNSPPPVQPEILENNKKEEQDYLLDTSVTPTNETTSPLPIEKVDVKKEEVVLSSSSSTESSSESSSDSETSSTDSENMAKDKHVLKVKAKKKKKVNKFDPTKKVTLNHSMKCYVKDEKPIRPITARPRPLYKEATSSDDESESESTDSSEEYYDSDKDKKSEIPGVRMSTCSNDSGFEGGTAPSSPKQMLGKL